MKITDVNSYIVHGHNDNWVFTRVTTDAGISGLGESSVEGRESTVVDAVSVLKDYLVGKDPFAIERHFYVMYRDAYWASCAVLNGALSAIDGALWDIKGKALGVPVYELLGGRFRDRVKLYANRWFLGAETPDDLAAKAEAVVAKGYAALKWDPFGTAEMTISRKQLNDAVAQTRAVRDAVGDDVEVLIEGHGRFNVATAVRVAGELAEFSPMFFEEPIMPENIDALAEVRERSPIPIAAGERFYGKQDFKAALDKKAVDFIQPDLRVTGGITEAKKIAALAEAAFVSVVPHNIHGPVGTAMSLQIMASSPNAEILEYSVEEIGWKDRLFDHRFEIRDGHMIIPDRPGLGLELNVAEAEKYPFERLSMISKMFEK